MISTKVFVAVVIGYFALAVAAGNGLFGGLF